MSQIFTESRSYRDDQKIHTPYWLGALRVPCLCLM